MACFFFDRNFSWRMVEDLRMEGVEVKVHHHHFADDARDDAWIPAVAALGWSIVSVDHRIRYVPTERAAVETSGARLFLLHGGNLPRSTRLEILRTALPRMIVLSDAGGSFIAKIQRSGAVEVWKRFA